MSISERVKQKRTDLRLTQSELAKRVGISQQSLQKIEDGRTQNPRKLLNLAKALDCDAEWLLLGTTNEVRENTSHYINDDQASQPFKNNLRPIITAQQAAQWPNIGELESLELKHLEVPDTVSATAFWLKVIGDNMMSSSGISVPEGYFILVEPALTANSGDLIVAKLADSKDVTFKKFVVDAGRTYLTPLNSNYRPIEVANDLEVVGVVTQARIMF
ncbi:helix-turn-helix domain-containing protein [Marinomonas rhizomae]|uniref:LexA family protein n=1 Tax=Marinomonas rhizomae TaxID=491948 RepID=UPI002108600C|nr:S24 family peptidase [Marinomonas rhizomae]UTW01142.1 helix-turn-helix domain-containing protein [Marinomonas rhizomae]